MGIAAEFASNQDYELKVLAYQMRSSREKLHFFPLIPYELKLKFTVLLVFMHV